MAGCWFISRNPMAEEPDISRVETAMNSLSEHFDTVQIFATRHEAEGTVHVSRGCGNWFARFGHVSEWVVRERESTRVRLRKEDDDE